METYKLYDLAFFDQVVELISIDDSYLQTELNRNRSVRELNSYLHEIPVEQIPEVVAGTNLCLEKLTSRSSIDRTQVGTISRFGHSFKFDLRDNNFPMPLSKTISMKNIFTELMWMMSGDTNITYLKENNCNIWNEWADENGDLGPIYGHLWRNFGGEVDHPKSGFDQLNYLLQSVKNHLLGDRLASRRIILSAWDPRVLPTEKVPSDNVVLGRSALPPCHNLLQLHVNNRNELCGSLYMRSNDLALGQPYNICFYSMLMAIIVDLINRVDELKTHNLRLGDLTFTIGDLHLYSNQIAQAIRQTSYINYIFEGDVGYNSGDNSYSRGVTLSITDKGKLNLDDITVDALLEYELSDFTFTKEIKHIEPLKFPYPIAV